MSDSAKAAPKQPAMKFPAKKVFKYPSEEEFYVRRLGSALLANWSSLSSEQREKIAADAVSAWDREYGVSQLAQKLDAFIKRYPLRMS
ncbi:MAG: hypothetical protein HY243_16540 [Proteobacteria bacterium]|nr:hypothetical protein [Pseudomonadota bacterium]